MFADTWMPSFAQSFLYGLDFDFMMLEVLVIACFDMSLVATDDVEAGPNAVAKPVNGLVVGVLVAYIVDYILIGIRLYKGRKNLATHTLSDERFLVGWDQKPIYKSQILHKIIEQNLNLKKMVEIKNKL